MRKLRFRLWDYALNLMDYSGLWNIGFDGRLYYGNAEFSDYKVIVMEYTGLKDANRTEIYEGDIMEFPSNFRSAVTWRSDYWECGGYPLSHSLCRSETLAKVIGNIFENKELLGGNYE